MLIVKIKKIFDNSYNQGTGFFVNLENKKYNMIITAAHCLKDNKQDNLENNKQNNIEISFEAEEKVTQICDSDIVETKIFSDDIGAIIIKKEAIKNTYINENIINFNKFDKEDSKEITEVYLRGYPHKANENDSELKTIEFKGSIQRENVKEKIFNFKYEPSGSLQSINEKERLEGFSGGIIYKYKNQKNFIIGMAQRIQCEDDNAYSQIEAINILDIFDILRRNNYIIYSLDGDNFRIKWIGKKEYTKDYTEENVLVVGSSGAGKSSFIKKFAYNNNKINSSGDGQTTRSDINYKFSLIEKKPRVEFEFLKKEEFEKLRFEAIEVEILEYQIKKLGLPTLDLKSKNDILFQYCMGNLEEYFTKHTEKEEYNKFIELKKAFYNIDFTNKINSNKEIKELTESLIEILEILQEKLGDIQFKVLFNRDYRKEVVKCEKINLKKEFNCMDNQKIEEKICQEIIDANEKSIKLIDKLKKYYNSLDKKEFLWLKGNLEKFILVQKGLFSYKEFDYLKTEDNKYISEIIEEKFTDIFSDLENLKYNDLKNKIRSFYRITFDLLEKYVKRGYENKRTLYLNELISDDDKLKLEMILKVTEKGSVSSLISKVCIYDKISNEYAFIIDELKIKTIIFIDTQGLDHIENGEFPEEKIYELFNRYHYNINNVFYIKKMDSGKPTELENIIPKLYEVKPNIALYCIFNGIDIFYSDHNERKVINWGEDENKIPKAPLYIKSKDGRDEIEHSMRSKRIKESRIKTVYSTLEKNLIPFCSNCLEEKNRQYMYNNKYYIKKLFKSLKVKEHLGLELVDTNKIIKEMKSEDFKKKLDEVLSDFFEKASIIDWFNSNKGHGHWKTKDSNINNIRQLKLGYSGAYNDLWNYNFNQAYSEMFSYEQDNNSVINIDALFNLNSNEIWKEKLEALLIDFRDVFLGCEEHNNSIFMTDNDSCIKCSKLNCFRKILIENYDIDNTTSKNIYKYKLNEKNIDDRAEYLNEICNFTKAYENSKEKFINLFIGKFSEKVCNENNKNINTILSINPEIDKTLYKLKELIEKSFLGSTNSKVFPEVIEFLLNKNK